MNTATLPALDPKVLAALHGRSLLVTRDWSAPEIDALLAVASRFEAADRAGRATDLLPNELAYALFFDNSTRTKSAWAGAASRLGMRPVIVDGSSTQVEHGETAEETGAMLGMNAHALGVRHDLILGEGNRFMRAVRQGIADYLAATRDPRQVPVVNLQCDVDHPTQVLADLMWLRESFPGGLRKKKIAMTWAYSPSYAKPLSVPQGAIALLARFGMDIVLAHPEGYELMDEPLAEARRFAAESGGAFRVVHAMEEAFENADVVYAKSWAPAEVMRERTRLLRAGAAARIADLERAALAQNARHTAWTCDEARMALTRGGKAQYMHCLPADVTGLSCAAGEVSRPIFDCARFETYRQAAHKPFVIAAMILGTRVDDPAGALGRLLDAAARRVRG